VTGGTGEDPWRASYAAVAARLRVLI